MYWYGTCVESYEGVKFGSHNGSYQIDSDHVIWFFYTHLGSSFGANDHKYLWMRPQPTWPVPFLAEHWDPCFQQLSCLLHSQRLPKSISIVSEEHERRSSRCWPASLCGSLLRALCTHDRVLFRSPLKPLLTQGESIVGGCVWTPMVLTTVSCVSHAPGWHFSLYYLRDLVPWFKFISLLPHDLEAQISGKFTRLVPESPDCLS